MPQERVSVREIAWLEIFPWLILLRTFRIAVQPKLLFVASVGVLLTWAGFAAIGFLFARSGDPEVQSQMTARGVAPIHWTVATERPVAASSEVAKPPLLTPSPAPTASLPPNPSTVVKPQDAKQPAATELTQITQTLSPANAQRAFYATTLNDVPVYWPWARLSEPFQELFSPNLSISGFAYNFLCAVWVALAWTLCGGIICRTAAMQLAAEEKISLGRATDHVRKKWLAYFLAPVGTMLAFLVIVLCVGLVGVILRAEVGLFLGALLWPVVLGLGVLGTLILAGLFFGWPLMWAVVAVEHSDHYDALSRSFTYVLSRPLHFLFYLTVVAGIGTLGWLAAATFAETVIYLSAWSACRFTHPELFGQIMAVVPHPAPGFDWPPANVDDVSGIGWSGLKIIQFWCGAVCLLVVGFVYSYFWTAAVGCYLLLRYHVDGNELDDIVLDDDDQPRELPPLGADEKGVPLAPDEPSEADSAD